MRQMISVFVFILLVPVPASAENTDKQKNVNEMIRVCAMDDRFADLRLEVLNAYRRGHDPDSAQLNEFHKALEETVSEFFDPNEMRHRFRRSLTAKVSESAVDKMTTYCLTDLGRRVTDLQKATGKSEIQELIKNSVTQIIERLEADTERMALLELMIVESSKLERVEAQNLEFSFAMTIGMIAGGMVPSDLTDEQVRSRINQMIAADRKNTVDRIYATMYLAYHKLTVEDLKQHTEFSLDPESLAISSAYDEAMMETLSDETFKFGREVRRHLESEEL